MKRGIKLPLLLPTFVPHHESNTMEGTEDQSTAENPASEEEEEVVGTEDTAEAENDSDDNDNEDEGEDGGESDSNIDDESEEFRR